MGGDGNDYDGARRFRYGDHVLIKPLDAVEGRVVGVEFDQEGWTINVRYFHEGLANTVKCFPDELLHADMR